MISSRRAVLRAFGAAAIPALSPGPGSGRGSPDDDGGHDRDDAGSDGHSRLDWRAVPAPTDRTLQDVAHTAAGPVAVGGGGTVIGRTGEGWRRVLANGPTGNGTNLHAVDAADGRAWLAGASGVLAAYDPRTGAVVDRSAPDGVTNTFTDVAATRGGVYVTDASGTVHASLDGDSWVHRTPGSGAAIDAMDFYAPRAGTLVDGDRSVYHTTDGRRWDRIGIDGADHALRALDADGPHTTMVAGGAIYERESGVWETHTPTGEALQDVGVGRCGCVHAVGSDGTVLHRPGHGMPGVDLATPEVWIETTPVGGNLHGIAIGPLHVAVGASGTVIERDHP